MATCFQCTQKLCFRAHKYVYLNYLIRRLPSKVLGVPVTNTKARFDSSSFGLNILSCSFNLWLQEACTLLEFRQHLLRKALRKEKTTRPPMLHYVQRARTRQKRLISIIYYFEG